MTSACCKVCGSTEGEIIFDVSRQPDTYLEYLGWEAGSDRHYVRCNTCGLVYRNSFFDQKQKEILYDAFRDVELRGESHEQYFTRITNLPEGSSENAEKYQFLSKFLAPTGVHLDVGGGLGVFCYGFQKHFPNWDSICIEPTPGAGDIAMSNDVKFINEYLTEKTDILGHKKLDLLTLNHVLEHVDEPAEFLTLLSSFMHSGTYLYIEVPDQNDLGFLPVSHDRFMCQHEVIFNAQSMSFLLNGIGLSIHFCEVFQSNRGRNNLRILAKK